MEPFSNETWRNWITKSVRKAKLYDLCAFDGEVVMKCGLVSTTNKTFPIPWPKNRRYPIYYNYKGLNLSIELHKTIAQRLHKVMDNVGEEARLFMKFKFNEAYSTPPYILFDFTSGFCGIDEKVGFKGDVIHKIFMEPKNGFSSIMTHLVLHVIGMGHEINHSNRDKYVHIFEMNLVEDDKRNYEKYPENEISKQFDFDPKSIMMYTMDEFQKSNLYPVIIPLLSSVNPYDFQRSVREVKTDDLMSFYDISKLHKLYGTLRHT